MSSREKEIAHQPGPTVALCVKGGSTQRQALFWWLEEGTHIHATHEGRQMLC